MVLTVTVFPISSALGNSAPSGFSEVASGTFGVAASVFAGNVAVSPVFVTSEPCSVDSTVPIVSFASQAGRIKAKNAIAIAP